MSSVNGTEQEKARDSRASSKTPESLVGEPWEQLELNFDEENENDEKECNKRLRIWRRQRDD